MFQYAVLSSYQWRIGPTNIIPFSVVFKAVKKFDLTNYVMFLLLRNYTLNFQTYYDHLVKFQIFVVHIFGQVNQQVKG